VLHAHGGEDGQDIARPAEFLVDQAGTIRWVNLTKNLVARLRPDTVLRVIDRLSMTPFDRNRGAKLKKLQKMIRFSATLVADLIVLRGMRQIRCSVLSPHAWRPQAWVQPVGRGGV